MQKIAVQIARSGLFGEHHRHIAERPRSHRGNGDARRLDGQDFRDRHTGKPAGEFLPYRLQQTDIHLVVQKAVHLEDIPIPEPAVLQNPLLKLLHIP